jgi:hypothetical protein
MKMNGNHARSIVFWLLSVSLLVLAALSTVILVKNVTAESETETVTAARSGPSQNPNAGQPPAAAGTSEYEYRATPTESPSVEPVAAPSESGEAYAYVEPALATEEAPAAYAGEPTFKHEYVEPAPAPESPSVEPVAAPSASGEAYAYVGPAPATKEAPAAYAGEPKFENVRYIEHRVTGRLIGVDPAEYAVVLFIKVAGAYYIKPSWQSGKTYLQEDGTFDIRAYTDDENKRNDQGATVYSVYCVPADFDVYDMADFSDLGTVRAVSVRASEDLPTGN